MGLRGSLPGDELNFFNCEEKYKIHFKQLNAGRNYYGHR